MQSSLVSALNYLAKEIDSGNITLVQFCDFSRRDWSGVPDGKPAMERDEAVVEAIALIATKAARCMVVDNTVTLDQLLEGVQAFGYKVARGQITLASLAILCNCSVDDLERQ